ncbi:ArsR family transcriptional regulator [Halovivax sp.]|uniref:DUF7344 domain-containing protein n=1 Tax=Halovivax sp. TaxID=1935978 RepID=UPI0025BB0E6E|nr:ArsR family transcriptional regulator [Halovivax sp.]
MATPMDLDATYSLLSDARRRHLLACFLDAEVWTVPDLAREIAAQECERAPDEDLVRRVRVGLVHNHLPRLADHGVLEWDGRSGDVVRADRFETVAPFLTVTGDGDELAIAPPPSDRR